MSFLERWRMKKMVKSMTDDEILERRFILRQRDQKTYIRVEALKYAPALSEREKMELEAIEKECSKSRRWAILANAKEIGARYGLHWNENDKESLQ